MLLPIIIFLMVLSPLFIPVLVTIVGAVRGFKQRAAAARPAFAGAVPAAA